MSLHVTVTCDGPLCTQQLDTTGLRATTDDALGRIGWIVQVRQRRSTIAGGTYDTTRHYCGQRCENADLIQLRALDARELVRR